MRRKAFTARAPAIETGSVVAVEQSSRGAHDAPTGVHVTGWQGPPPSPEEIERRFHAEGLSPRAWGNAPGDRYGWHDHDYHKVLYCVSGSIVFHTDDGDVELGPGDRMDLQPRKRHAATVGSEGVQCMEAPR